MRLPSVVSLVPAPHAGMNALRKLELDLDIHAGRQIEAGQRLDCLGRGLDDVDEPLVRANLELLARIFVDEWRPQDRILRDLGRQWHRAGYTRAGVLCRIDDLRSRLVQDPVVIGLQPDADSLLGDGSHAALLSVAPPPKSRRLPDDVWPRSRERGHTSFL